MSYVLGVDLGTTFTAAAVANGAAPTMVGLGNRALQIPSVLFLADNGFLIGEAAERRGWVDPSRVVREFKRRLGDPVPILVGGSPFSAEALTARLLHWVVESVTALQGEPPRELILTHPASWGPYRLEVLGQVATLADVGQARWCAEPLAAAAQYAARSRVPVGSKLAVYDLGGGTFDACVLEQTTDGFVIMGVPQGVEHLGGVDFDEALFRHVVDLVAGQADTLDADSREIELGLARLRRDCVEAKEALSSDVEAVVPVSLSRLSTTIRITRQDFESLIRPALEQTLDATERALRSANVEAGDLASIIMVGGSSRIPLVSELLQARFKVPTRLDTHPKHDVVLGAVQMTRRPQPLADEPVRTVLPDAASGDEAETSTLPPEPPPAPPSSGSMPIGSASMPSPATLPPAAGPAPMAPAPLASPATLPPAARPMPITSAAISSPVTVPPSTPATQRPQADRRRRRGGLLPALAVGVAAIVAGVAVGFAVEGGGRRPVTGNPVTPSASTAPTVSTSAAPSSTTPTPTPSPTPTVSHTALPQSAPLTDRQLIVPMKVDGNWDLYLADVGHSSPGRRLTSGPPAEYGQVLSPDRRTLIYLYDPDVNDNRRTLRVAGAADGKGARELFAKVPGVCNAMMFRPAWSPVNPDLLAVPCTNTAGHWGLYLIRTDGTVVREIRVPGVAVDDPSFSPDGTGLVFWAGLDKAIDGGSLYVAALDPNDGSSAGELRHLTSTQLAGQDGDPAWSPDGSTILFRRRVVDGTPGGRSDIYVIRADGSGKPKALTHDAAKDQDPAYSPSGSRIAFQSTRSTPYWPGPMVSRVWVMNSDGSDQHLLWTKKAPDRQVAAAWSRR
jgi:molecular chaperone DnaK